MGDLRLLLFLIGVVLVWRLVKRSGVPFPLSLSSLFRPAAVFVVRVRRGEPAATRGKVTPAFLSVVREVCRECGVESGEVRGISRGRALGLWFSSDFPPGCQQRLRNWWGFAGWRA